jgi:hypothetical protein
VKVGTSYDEEHEEECNWPDKDIAFIYSEDSKKNKIR